MNIEDLKRIEEANDINDQKEVINEMIKIQEYKSYLYCNPRYSYEVQNFIIEIINKYRSKEEVKIYYNKPGGDNIDGNQYNTLCSLEGMITQYALVKFGEEFFKKYIVGF